MSDKVTAWLRGEGEMPEPLDVAFEMANCVWHWQQNAKADNVAEADWDLYHPERIIKKIREQS